MEKNIWWLRQDEYNISERRACRFLNQDRLTQRYVAKQPDIDRPLINEIVRLSEKHPRYGYRRICAIRNLRFFFLNNKNQLFYV